VGKVKDVYDDITAAVRRAVANRERKSQFPPRCICDICLSYAATHGLFKFFVDMAGEYDGDPGQENATLSMKPPPILLPMLVTMLQLSILHILLTI
jgi:hypothetical protein